MSKRGFASFAAAFALLGTSVASAQSQNTAQANSPQWLKDRRYSEGVGIRTGNLELHPGLAGEFGYDSNYFLRSTRGDVENGSPLVPALVFRVTPSLYLSTLGPRRREGDSAGLPDFAFRLGVNGSLREYIALVTDTRSTNSLSGLFQWDGTADGRLDILPGHPVGGAVYANYTHVDQPNAADPNLSFNRESLGAGGEVVVQPGRGTLDWRLGYQFNDTIFDTDKDPRTQQPLGFTNWTNEAYTRGRWRFRPRTALVYDAALRWINFKDVPDAAREGLVDATPLRARLGINGLVTDRFALLAMAGYGASFVSTAEGPSPQYDSVIGQAELRWYLAANPGVDNPGDLGLALSSIALGYTRDFQQSYLGNFYGLDRGYLKFFYFFAGRALATLEGGLAALSYPTVLNYLPAMKANAIRQDSHADARADVTLFGEYRVTDSFAVNSTVRYTQTFSSTLVPEPGEGKAVCNVAGQKSCFDLAWQRFEAYVGLRWLM